MASGILAAFRFTRRHGNTKRTPNVACCKFVETKLSLRALLMEGGVDLLQEVTVVFLYNHIYRTITLILALLIHVGGLLRLLPATAKHTSSWDPNFFWLVNLNFQCHCTLLTPECIYLILLHELIVRGEEEKPSRVTLVTGLSVFGPKQLICSKSSYRWFLPTHFVGLGNLSTYWRSHSLYI